MAKTKKFNEQKFMMVINGEHVCSYCHTTWGYEGPVHTLEFWGLGLCGVKSRVRWGMRTWESFDYEVVLKAAAQKLRKADRLAMEAEIEKIAGRHHEECEKFCKAFESSFAALNDDNKKRVADLCPDGVQNAAQAQAVAGYAGLLNILQK